MDSLGQKPLEQEIWGVLEEIKDPEIPVVTLAEMGILRGVEVQGSRVKVLITPTYSGCPALHMMREEIVKAVRNYGYPDIIVEVVYSPAWTTDWIAPSAREKLKKFGINPPPKHAGQFEIPLAEAVPCPFCDSTQTEIRNHFGPTPCRALAYCKNCQQPFEWFKPI